MDQSIYDIVTKNGHFIVLHLFLKKWYNQMTACSRISFVSWGIWKSGKILKLLIWLHVDVSENCTLRTWVDLRTVVLIWLANLELRNPYFSNAEYDVHIRNSSVHDKNSKNFGVFNPAIEIQKYIYPSPDGIHAQSMNHQDHDSILSILPVCLLLNHDGNF